MKRPVFPTDLVRAEDRCLVLFAAAFGGVQDAVPLRDAGVREATCVDIDKEKLDAMRPSFPESWRFVQGDAFEVVFRGWEHDVVSADPWSGDLEERVWRELVPALLKTKARLLVFGVTSPNFVFALRTLAENEVNYFDLRKRSDFQGGCWWIVVPR